MRAVDEFNLIGRYFRPLATAPEALDLRDDAALLSVPPGHELAITKDAMVAGVHFLGTEPPALIARKLLRVNLSDLAAMGAQPLGYFLALALPPGADERWPAGFADGLREDGAAFGFSLLGGDTVAGGALTLSLTALGTVPVGEALLRSGARAGDTVWVSGAIGDGLLGLRMARRALSTSLTEIQTQAQGRYLLPQPRVALGMRLRGLATACMDVSDGLTQDAAHLAGASGVGVTLRLADVPLSPAWRALAEEEGLSPADAVAGGDDYELLFTAPESAAARIREAAQASGMAVTAIGQVTQGEGVRLLDAAGRAVSLARTGYRHTL